MKLRAVISLFFALWTWSAATGAGEPQWRFENVTRVVAVGDIHGDYKGLIEVLQAAGVIDQERAWSGGEAHLVVVGDSVDRGPASLEVLEFLMGLQEQAQKSGGRVHVLLGNHEAMVLSGDLRYASQSDLGDFAGEAAPLRDKALARFTQATEGRFKDQEAAQAAFAARYPRGYFGLKAAYAPDSRVGRWLLQLPLMVVVNDSAFIHGGLSELVTEPATLNQRARDEFRALLDAWQSLIEAGIALPEYPLLGAADAAKAALEGGRLKGYPEAIRDAAHTLSTARQALVFHPQGPLWYRGNAVCHPLVEKAVLEKALAALGVSRLVVSHTPTRSGRIEARMDGQLIRLDTGEDPLALVIHNGTLNTAFPGQDSPQPLLMSEQHPLAGVPLSAKELESFLKDAPIIATEAVGAGVTKPLRLTLEQNGIRLRAIFKSAQTPTVQTGRLKLDRAINLADRHVYDIAAYRLDRLLGLNMVPVTVGRTVDGRDGSLQYWVEDSVNERQRREMNLNIESLCPLEKQYALMELFDRLIYNTDRTQENILYTQDWRVALIDHSRSFRTTLGIPATVREVSLAAAPGFARHLAELDREKLEQALGELLDDRQIWALLARRDQMLKE